MSARKQASAGRLRGRLPRRRASLLDAPDADGKEINSCNNAASCPRIVPRALPHFIMLRATSRRSAPRPSRNSSSRRARHEHSGRVAAAPRRRGSGRRDSVDRAARQTGQSDRKWTGEDTLWTAHASHQISDSLLSDRTPCCPRSPESASASCPRFPVDKAQDTPGQENPQPYNVAHIACERAREAASTIQVSRLYGCGFSCLGLSRPCPASCPDRSRTAFLSAYLNPVRE